MRKTEKIHEATLKFGEHRNERKPIHPRNDSEMKMNTHK